MHSLRLPKIVGGLEEVALRMRPDSASYAQMYQRIQDPQSDFDPLFQASLLVHERVKDAEIMSKMVAFWRGEKLDLAETRRSLKVLGLPMQLKQRRIADLALPRFRFAAELVAGVGYSGWVLLLDELELVGLRSLTTSLFQASQRTPLLLLCLAQEVPPDLFRDELEVLLPVCRLAAEADLAELDRGEVAELAAEPAIHLFWRPGPPDPQSPARRLLDSLARRGLLVEPFERIPAGLQEALAAETVQ
jgi:hypothetical protein